MPTITPFSPSAGGPIALRNATDSADSAVSYPSLGLAVTAVANDQRPPELRSSLAADPPPDIKRKNGSRFADAAKAISQTRPAKWLASTLTALLVDERGATEAARRDEPTLRASDVSGVVRNSGPEEGTDASPLGPESAVAVGECDDCGWFSALGEAALELPDWMFYKLGLQRHLDETGVAAHGALEERAGRTRRSVASNGSKRLRSYEYQIPLYEQREFFLRPIMAALAFDGTPLPHNASNALICRRMGAALWPLPDEALSDDQRVAQERLAAEMLNQRGLADATFLQSGRMDELVRRGLVADMFAHFALGALSPDAFLEEALASLNDVRKSWYEGIDDKAFADLLLLVGVDRETLYGYKNEDLIQSVARYYADLAKSESTGSAYTGPQLASALGRNMHHLGDEERATFDMLASLLAENARPSGLVRHDRSALGNGLLQQAKRRWAAPMDAMSQDEVDRVARAFIDLLLPGFNEPLMARGEAIRQGSVSWSDHILAQAVLRGAQTETALSRVDAAALALIGEQQAFNNNTEFVQLYERMALVAAVMEPDSLSEPIAWPAVIVGDGVEQRRARITAKQSFAAGRAARWEETALIAAALEAAQGREPIPTRRELAERILKAEGLDPSQLIEKAPEASQWLPSFGHGPRRIQIVEEPLLEVYLSEGTAASKVPLRAEGYALPVIDDEYENVVRSGLSRITTDFAPLVLQLMHHGNGPRDTHRQWSADPHAGGTTDAMRKQAARDWFDGTYYTKTDRDFLHGAEVRLHSSSIVINDKGYGRYVADRVSEPRAMGTALFLRAKRGDEQRDYVVWMRGDKTMAITRFAESIEDTGLEQADFNEVLGPSAALRQASPGRPPSGKTEDDWQNRVFFRRQMERLHTLSEGDRANLLEEQGMRTVTFHHRLKRIDDKMYRANSAKARTELSAAMMQTWADRAFQSVYDEGYGQTSIQAAHAFSRKLLTSMIPFYDCISTAVNGDALDAAGLCALDAVGMIPVAFAGVKLSRIASRTALGIAAKARAMRPTVRVSARTLAGMATREMVKARPGYMAVLKHAGKEFVEELMPLPVQWGLAARRLTRAINALGRSAKEAKALASALEGIDGKARLALINTYGAEPAFIFEQGQRMLALGGHRYPMRLLYPAGADAVSLNLPVSRIDDGRFVAVNSADGVAIGPELIALGDGRLRSAVSPVLPLQAVTRHGRRFEVVAEVYRTKTGEVQRPVVEDWRLAALPGKDNHPLVGIDGHPYRVTDTELRRLTLHEQSRLERRTSRSSYTDDRIAIQDADGAVLQVAPAGGLIEPTLAGLLESASYGDSYAVPEQLHALLSASTRDADDVIRHRDTDYIAVHGRSGAAGERYYRIERRSGDHANIVHWRDPYLHLQIPVRFDRAAGRWIAADSYGLRGGGLLDFFKKRPSDVALSEIDDWVKSVQKWAVRNHPSGNTRGHRDLVGRRYAFSIQEIRRYVSEGMPSRLTFVAPGIDPTGGVDFLPVFREPSPAWRRLLSQVQELTVDELKIVPTENPGLMAIDKWDGLSVFRLKATLPVTLDARPEFAVVVGENMPELRTVQMEGLYTLTDLSVGRQGKMPPLLDKLDLIGNKNLNSLNLASVENSMQTAVIKGNPKLAALPLLADCSNLKMLVYEKNAHAPLPSLARLTKLEQLGLEVPPSASGIEGLDELPDLERLELAGIHNVVVPWDKWPALHPDVSLIALRAATPMNGLVPPGMNTGRLLTLNRRNAGNRKRPLANLDELHGAVNLRTLDVRSTTFVDDTFAVGSLSSLERLTAENCKLVQLDIGATPEGAVHAVPTLPCLSSVSVKKNRLRHVFVAKAPALRRIDATDNPYPETITLDGAYGAGRDALHLRLHPPAADAAPVLPDHSSDKKWIAITEPPLDERVHYVIDLSDNRLTSIPPGLREAADLVGVEFLLAGNPLGDDVLRQLSVRSMQAWPRFTLVRRRGGDSLTDLFRSWDPESRRSESALANLGWLERIGNAKDASAGFAEIENVRRKWQLGGLDLVADRGKLGDEQLKILREREDLCAQPIPIEEQFFHYLDELPKDVRGAPADRGTQQKWQLASELFRDPLVFDEERWLNRFPVALREKARGWLAEVKAFDGLSDWKSTVRDWRSRYNGEPETVQAAMEAWRKAVMQWRERTYQTAKSVSTLFDRIGELPQVKLGDQDEILQRTADMLAELKENPKLFKVLDEEQTATGSNCADRVLGEMNLLDVTLRRERLVAGPDADTRKLADLLLGQQRLLALNQHAGDILREAGLRTNEQVEVFMYLAAELRSRLDLPLMSESMTYTSYAEYLIWRRYSRELGFSDEYEVMRNDAAAMAAVRQRAIQHAEESILVGESLDTRIDHLANNPAWRTHLLQLNSVTDETDSDGYIHATRRLLDEIGAGGASWGE